MGRSGDRPVLFIARPPRDALLLLPRPGGKEDRLLPPPGSQRKIHPAHLLDLTGILRRTIRGILYFREKTEPRLHLVQPHVLGDLIDHALHRLPPLLAATVG